MTLPPPPSATDRAPAANPGTAARKPAVRKPARTAKTRDKPPAGYTETDRSTFSRSTNSDRIDMRGPGKRGDMEMEDDPRAARPTMENGRMGMGMRF